MTVTTNDGFLAWNAVCLIIAIPTLPIWFVGSRIELGGESEWHLLTWRYKGCPYRLWAEQLEVPEGVRTVKVVFKRFDVGYSVFHHLSPSANFFSPPLVPFFLCALVSLSRNYSSSEDAYIERGERYEISLNSTLSPHNKDSLVFSSIEPGSVTSSYCRSDHLFQSSIDYRQFPFNYDILTADFDCYERKKRCLNYTK